MAPRLELQNLVRSYPGFQLGPVTKSFASGCVHGLLGPNGAGKTTLLNVLALQTRATSGTVLFGDARVVWGQASWKQRVAYVRETPAFYDELTVGETLRFARRLYDRWDVQAASTLARRMALPEGKRVRALSKGTRVKLGIVVALAHRADVLLLDEPTAGVDPTARDELYDVLTAIRRDRPELCVLWSSHIFDDVEASADTLTILREGRIAFEGTREGLTALALDRKLSVQGVIAAIYRGVASGEAIG